MNPLPHNELLSQETIRETGSVRDRCFHQLFEAQVKKSPHAVAVIFEDRQLTYGELDQRANALAGRLQTSGVKLEVPVAIFMERSLELAVGILGVLKAGGGCVPLDPAYPRARLEFMLSDARVPVVLTQERLAGDLPECDAQQVVVEFSDATAVGVNRQAPVSRVTADNLAFVFYTSGTTGKPKGVVGTHRAHLNDLLWKQETLKLSDKHRHLLKCSISFSPFLREFFWPLLTGGTVVMAPPGAHQDVAALIRLIAGQKITVASFVPSMLRPFLEAPGLESCASLEHVLCGGEPLSAEIENRFISRLNAKLHQFYGATEAPAATYRPCGPRNGDDAILLGRPTNMQVYLLDGQLREVPAGEPGEIYIAGDGVARGYLNLPDLTARRFIANPFTDRGGPRLYRTGDNGRFRDDGNLEFLGRIDHQVKVRGFRVEPEDIETVLSRHPFVDQAVVVARRDQAGDQRLIAYVTTARESARPNGELRSYLQARLPDYMVPSAFVVLDRLPVSPNGKVDRTALPAPERQRPELEQVYAAPESPLQMKLAEFWEQALELDRIGIHDNFFELGGHSLMALRIVARVRDEMQVELPLPTFFEAPTIAAMARDIECRRSGEASETQQVLNRPPIVPDAANRHVPFPLNELQEAYWIGRSNVFELGQVSTHRYIEFDADDLNLDRFNEAFRRVIDRHDMLRAIVLPDGQQQILERVAPYEIEITDLRDAEPEAAERELQSIRRRMSHQVLPSDRWPLFEVRATRLTDHRTRLHLSFDALILDYRSRIIIFKEWYDLYRHPETGLKPLELSFRDCMLANIAHRESEPYRIAEAYWRSRLETLPPAPQLPLAKSPEEIEKPRFRRWCTRIEPAAWTKIKEQANRLELTPSVVLLAAYAEVLKTWCKSPRFTLNLTFLDRPPLHAEIDDIVGDFTSLVMLEVNNSAEPTFEARARRLQQQLWTDLDHQSFNGIRVLRELGRSRFSAPRANMPVVFTSALAHDTWHDGRDLMSWMGKEVYNISQTPQVWLDHPVFEQGGALVFNWDVVAELFPDGMLDDMFNSYVGLLRRLSDDETVWIGSWSDVVGTLLPPEQRQKRLDVNATAGHVPDGVLHERFLDQVQRRPDQPAVISDDRQLTYVELARASSRVGRKLRQLGAEPNRLVAVVMEKGWEQVVGVMGVLQSGAAYLPIEATLPKERIWHLLEHGEVELVLTQSRFDESLDWPDGVQRLCVDDETEWGGYDDRPLPAVQKPDDLAYVIYTSGSTGQPKGVMIDHRGALNTVVDINRRFSVAAEDRVLALSSLGFDLSVYDVFGTLAAGAAIVVPGASDVRNPARWAELIKQERVTVWNSVPALLELLVEWVDGRQECVSDALRLVLLSGDWIPVTLPDQIRTLVGDVEVISLGGATEASIWSILYPIGNVEPRWKSIPYGRPMLNQTLHVLNQDFEPCPTWTTGRLYIGGIGLARGYWREPELTESRFITHPGTGERLYHTGDLGRFLPDGNIEFLGREDFQVKIQGHRIELGEIEATLSRHPAVKQAVVTAVGASIAERRLAAYVVSEPDHPLSLAEMREFLLTRLPAYMVPSQLVDLQQLPLSSNGKVDRRALPDPGEKDAGYEEAPQSVDHAGIAEVAPLVCEVMCTESIDARADLLNLGATSIDMIRIVNLLEKRLGFRPSINQFYREPTIVCLAAAYDLFRQSRDAAPATCDTPGSPDDPRTYPLLRDPVERDEFKYGQPGLRRLDAAHPSFPLDSGHLSDSLEMPAFTRRRSYRQFGREPIAAHRFGAALAALRQIRVNGRPKYLYGSAGGLYPVQAQLYVKPKRVAGLEGGYYSYDPVAHQVVLLSGEVSFDADLFDPFINGPIFEQSAFTLFLVAQLQAIAPMYGDKSLHFAAIEAGLISQLLEMTGPDHGIGFCQVGSMNFEPLRERFALEESHLLMHTLLGGPIAAAASDRWSPFQESHWTGTEPASDREEGTL